MDTLLTNFLTTNIPLQPRLFISRNYIALPYFPQAGQDENITKEFNTVLNMIHRVIITHLLI